MIFSCTFHFFTRTVGAFEVFLMGVDVTYFEIIFCFVRYIYDGGAKVSRSIVKVNVASPCESLQCNIHLERS